ncbi:MAG TPA: hypothetical protein VGQ46_06070 [Thermoanaerobaculia bacterium]|nr:hypothetical protein [Thermoanaerobaculia bacterium]
MKEKTVQVAVEPLLIITPTPVEFKAMTGKLSAKGNVTKAPPVVEGQIGSARVIVALGGKGQELTATAVTRLDERFKPRYIFLVGVGGGFAPLSKGDVLIANSVHDLDYGKVEAGKFLRRPELDWTPDHGLIQAASLLADGDGEESWRRWITAERPEHEPARVPEAKIGYGASSSKVIDDPQHPAVAEAFESVTEILVVEMEAIGAGVAVKVAQSERRVGLLMVRGISDMPAASADEKAEGSGTKTRTSWKPFAADAAAAFTAALIEELYPAGEGDEENGPNAQETARPAAAQTTTDIAALAEAFLSAAGLKPISLISGSEQAPAESVPPTIARVSRRMNTVAALRDDVASATWTSIIGEPQSGKTQLAALISQEWQDVVWFSDASLASAETLRQRLRTIAGSARSIDSDLCRAAIAALPEHVLLVFDDLAPLDKNDQRTGILRDLANAAAGNAHILSLSSGSAPRAVRDVLGDRFTSRPIPPFTDDEARNLFTLHGAPNLPEPTVAFLNGVAQGNPTLLAAVAEYLKERAWRIDLDEVNHLLSGAHLDEIRREVMARLREDVQDAETRELFSRTRLARRPVTTDDVRALAEVHSPIDRVLERLFDLDGLWLRRETSERYSATPLAAALPHGDLHLTTERGCHAVLAERILDGRVDREGVIDSVWHFIQAHEFNRAGSVLAYALSKIVESEAWHETLIPTMFTTQPLPPAMALPLRLFIRTQQLKIARKQGKRQPALVKDAVCLVAEAAADEAAVVASFAVEAAIEDTGDRDLWLAAMDALSRLLDLRPDAGELIFMGQALPNDTWAMLFYMVGRCVRSVEDVDRWTNLADRLPAARRQQILASAFDRQSLINAAWLRNEKRAEAPWPDVLAVHRRWREWAERVGDELLWAYAVRAEVIVRAEYMGEGDDSLAFANEMLTRATTPRARFILNDTIATQLRRLRRYEDAERWYEAAFVDLHAVTSMEQVFALHNAASVVATRDLAAAATLLERAQRTIHEAPGEFDAVRLSMVSADLGLAYWYDGRRAEAFAEWDSVAQMLFDEDTVEDEPRRGLMALLMTVLRQIADPLWRDKQKPSEEERAVVGTFDRGLTELAAHWKPAQAPHLATDLAHIGVSIGRDDRASHWIDRAVEVADEMNEPVVTAYVAMEAVPWALLRGDLKAATRFIAALRDTRERAPKTGESEIAQYVLLATFHLGSVMLLEPARAREGMATLSAGLREMSDDPDASMLASALEAASKNDGGEEIASICERTDAGTAVGTVARLLQSIVRRRSTPDRAVDHLAIGPAATRRSSLWGVGYERIVIPFFETFWRREAATNAFRFRDPAAFRRELDEIRAVPPERRVQVILNTVSNALGMEVSRGFREWFTGARA